MATSWYSTLGFRSGRMGTVLTGPPRTHSVTPHQTRITRAMTVVAIMIFSALSLDSWMPRMFWRKK